ncbi:MAG: YCF48-related protein [Amphritea sp.]
MGICKIGSYGRALCVLFALLLTTGLSAQDRLSSPPELTTRAEEGLLLDIARAGDSLIAVGDHGVVLVSVDNGNSWQQIETPTSVLLTAVTFIDKKNGWMVGHDGLLARSLDGGQSWQTQLDGEKINRLRLGRLGARYAGLEQQASQQPDNDALAEQLDEMSYQLDDAQIALEEGPTTPLLDVWFEDSRTGFVLGGYGLFLKTTDGGENWQYWGDRLPNPDGFHLNSLIQDHQKRLYIAGEAGLLLRSDDGGDSWIALDSPYEGSFFSITEYRQQLYLMGLRGHLYRSTDAGEQWQELDTGSVTTLNGAAVIDDQLLLVGHGGVLLQASDNEPLQLRQLGVRRSWSSAVATADSWLLVGEGGVLRMPLQRGESNE